METKQISIGRVAFDNNVLVGFSLISFSKISGCSRKTLRAVLTLLQNGGYAPVALQHLLGNTFLPGFKSTDKYLRVEAVDELLAYFAGGANKFRKSQSKAAIAKFAPVGGFASYVHRELGQLEEIKPSAVSVVEPDTAFDVDDTLVVDWEQYKKDSQASKQSPLPRCIIPIAGGIEVFGLPGFEKQRGRYLLSLTNAAEAVGKAPQSISDFLASNAFKALFRNTYSKAFQTQLNLFPDSKAA